MFRKLLIPLVAAALLILLIISGTNKDAEANVIACTPTITVARFYESGGLVMTGYNIQIVCNSPAESIMITGAFQRFVLMRYSTMGGSISTMLCGGVPYCAVQWSNYLSPGLYRVSSETALFHEGREWGPYKNYLYFQITQALAVVPITGTVGGNLNVGTDIIISDPTNVSLNYSSDPCDYPNQGVIQWMDNSQGEDKYVLFYSRWDGSGWAYQYSDEVAAVAGRGGVGTVVHNFDPYLPGWWRVGVQAVLLGFSSSNTVTSGSLAMPYSSGCATLVQPSNVVLGASGLGSNFMLGSWADNSTGEASYHVDLFYWSGAWYLLSQYDLGANATSLDMSAGAGSTWYYFNAMAGASGSYGPVGTSNIYAP